MNKTLTLVYIKLNRSYEQSAMVSKEMNDWNSVIKYFEQSSHLFREHGVPDTAALTLNRGAQYVFICIIIAINDHLYEKLQND